MFHVYDRYTFRLGERWRHYVKYEQLHRDWSRRVSRESMCVVLFCCTKYIYYYNLRCTSYEPESIVLYHLFVTRDSDSRRARISENTKIPKAARLCTR